MSELSELRGLDKEALKGKLIDLRKEQFNLRFQRALGQLEKTSEMKRVRRNIARLKTVMNERSAVEHNGGQNAS